ncbi:hypothetical protein N8508_00505 [bacterium]|nr:hypothetical protein [bacterium]
MAGRKNIAKLVKKVIVNKNGKRTTVYVKVDKLKPKKALAKIVVAKAKPKNDLNNTIGLIKKYLFKDISRSVSRGTYAWTNRFGDNEFAETIRDNFNIPFGSRDFNFTPNLKPSELYENVDMGEGFKWTEAKKAKFEKLLTKHVKDEINEIAKKEAHDYLPKGWSKHFKGLLPKEFWIFGKERGEMEITKLDFDLHKTGQGHSAFFDSYTKTIFLHENYVNKKYPKDLSEKEKLSLAKSYKATAIHEAVHARHYIQKKITNYGDIDKDVLRMKAVTAKETKEFKTTEIGKLLIMREKDGKLPIASLGNGFMARRMSPNIKEAYEALNKKLGLKDTIHNFHQYTAFTDTLMSVDITMGFGHEYDYMKKPKKRAMEWYAHSGEQYFQGNKYLEAMMPKTVAKWKTHWEEEIKLSKDRLKMLEDAR